MKKNLTKRKWIAYSAVGGLLTAMLYSCTDTVVELNNQSASNDAIMQMEYTVTKTTFVDAGNGTPITPSVSKEEVSLKVYEGDDFLMRVDIRDNELDSYHQTELIATGEDPEPSHYIMTPGHFSVYDLDGSILTEQSMPELQFDGLTEQLKKSAHTANLHTIATGGMVIFDLINKQVPNQNLRVANDEYELYEETYTDELDGKQYTQKVYVDRENNTINAMALYDASMQLISSERYRYEGEGENLRLKNTQSVLLDEDPNGALVKVVTLAEYENFSIHVNFEN